MTVVYTYLASDNARNRRRAKRAAERELKPVKRNDRVLTAVTQAPDWRVRPEQQESAGSICLPEVARYNAGFRKSENITAR